MTVRQVLLAYGKAIGQTRPKAHIPVDPQRFPPYSARLLERGWWWGINPDAVLGPG